MFKYASLHTMNNLMSTKSETQQSQILPKALSVLFTEPVSRDSKGYDKQLVSELIEMLKTQIK